MQPKLKWDHSQSGRWDNYWARLSMTELAINIWPDYQNGEPRIATWTFDSHNYIEGDPIESGETLLTGTVEEIQIMVENIAISWLKDDLAAFGIETVEE